LPRRSKRRSLRPLPIGAAFLAITVLAVLFAIFWRSSPEDSPAERSFKPLEEPIRATGEDRDLPGAPPSAGSGRFRASTPRDLTGLLEAYLSGRRLVTTPATREVDLTCRVPEGGSLFKVHAELSRAVEVWGGAITSGEEKTLEKGQRALDLRITRGRESVRLRLLHDRGAPDDCRIVLVIDDFGFQEAGLVARFFDLPVSFTPAILPGYPQTASAIRMAQMKGRSPILHLPMEPKEYPEEDPGPGALFVQMDRSQKRAILEKDLRDFAGVVGVSNHMGSKASEDTALVGAVLDVLKERGLFFLDSGTSMQSAFPAGAARSGVPCLAADVFLDGEANPTPGTMARRLREARDLAFRTGSAILIGHARPATLAFLRSAPDSLRIWGCRVVPLTDLLR
jgi:polysaccharide deacetylase 2 family uncharacterized protein YibQ